VTSVDVHLLHLLGHFHVEAAFLNVNCEPVGTKGPYELYSPISQTIAMFVRRTPVLLKVAIRYENTNIVIYFRHRYHNSQTTCPSYHNIRLPCFDNTRFISIIKFCTMGKL